MMIGAEVLLPQGEGQKLAKFIRQAVDKNDTTIGNHAVNLLLNALIYDVEFPDEVVRRYAANMIAENVLAQCDADGF